MPILWTIWKSIPKLKGTNARRNAILLVCVDIFIFRGLGLLIGSILGKPRCNIKAKAWSFGFAIAHMILWHTPLPYLPIPIVIFWEVWFFSALFCFVHLPVWDIVMVLKSKSKKKDKKKKKKNKVHPDSDSDSEGGGSELDVDEDDIDSDSDEEDEDPRACVDNVLYEVQGVWGEKPSELSIGKQHETEVPKV